MISELNISYDGEEYPPYRSFTDCILDEQEIGSYSAQFAFFGRLIDYNIQIIENPVERIEAEDITIEEFTHGQWVYYEYDEAQNTYVDVDDPWYLYNFIGTITVYWKDGTTTKGTQDELFPLLGYRPTIRTINDQWINHLSTGTYSAKASYLGVESPLTITILPSGSMNPFTDVKDGKYYYNAVLWAISQDPPVTNGTSETTFSPNNTCTRGQVVTFIWNAMGKPEPDLSDNPFVDVKDGKFYYKAVLWAYQNGVTSGADATHFNPNGQCTRAQVVTFLWNAAGKPEPKTNNNPFQDVKEGKFYTKAVLWAVENGITSGMSADTFGTNNTCTRGQVVTFLFNAYAVTA